MNEPVMYPSTDYPQFAEWFDSFTELRECVEDLDESLNFVVSWFPNAPDLEFTLLIFMPRRSETTEFRCRLGGGERAVVDEWLNGYVRQRTVRWYGWDDVK